MRSDAPRGLATYPAPEEGFGNSVDKVNGEMIYESSFCEAEIDCNLCKIA